MTKRIELKNFEDARARHIDLMHKEMRDEGLPEVAYINHDIFVYQDNIILRTLYGVFTDDSFFKEYKSGKYLDKDYDKYVETRKLETCIDFKLC
jgi:hypothetical protein